MFTYFIHMQQYSDVFHVYLFWVLMKILPVKGYLEKKGLEPLI
jgi:hypothetical protein